MPKAAAKLHGQDYGPRVCDPQQRSTIVWCSIIRRAAAKGHCCESQIRGPAPKITSDAISALTEGHRSAHGARGAANNAAIMIIPPTWSLPESIRTRLGQTTYGRQRAIIEEGHLLLVLHKVPGPDDRAREGVLFWRSPNNEWQWNRGGPGPGALKRHIQSYGEVEAKLAQQYDDASGIDALFDLVEALTPVTRAARNMHNALQAAREGIPNDTFLIEMRDLAYEIDRNLDLMLEDVRNAIQYHQARESEEQARLGKEALRASHRLNTLAAMFFPLTAIASIFGMQLAHGLDEHNPVIFWTVFLVGGALGFVMKSWVMAKPRLEPGEKLLD